MFGRTMRVSKWCWIFIFGWTIPLNACMSQMSTCIFKTCILTFSALCIAPFVPVKSLHSFTLPFLANPFTHPQLRIAVYWATDMRQAAVAVCTKQISTEPKSHPYPLHIHDGLCAYLCVWSSTMSPAMSRAHFPAFVNKPVKGVVTTGR